MNLRALGIATLATLLLVVVGSRNLQNFDAALAIFLERYLQHSRSSFIDTSCGFSVRNGFFKRSFELLFSGKALAYGWELAKHFFWIFVGLLHGRIRANLPASGGIHRGSDGASKTFACWSGSCENGWKEASTSRSQKSRDW